VLAADAGLGVLAGPFKPTFMIEEDLENFRKRCHELGRDPDALGFGMTIGVVVLDDHERAREIAATNIRWFYEQLLRLTGPVLERGGEAYKYYREELGTLRALTGGTPSLEALEAAGMVVAGNPEHAIEQLRRLQGNGIDHVLCALQAGGVPHQEVLRCIELMGERVIPAMREAKVADGDGRPERADLRIFLRESDAVTPELLFESMPMAFRRDRANGVRALYRVDLSGDGGGSWWVRVADGACEVLREDPGQRPDVRIRSDAETWVGLAKGTRSRTGAVLRRRLKVRGNRREAARFAKLFG
jgi:hypothetical protein